MAVDFGSDFCTKENKADFSMESKIGSINKFNKIYLKEKMTLATCLDSEKQGLEILTGQVLHEYFDSPIPEEFETIQKKEKIKVQISPITSSISPEAIKSGSITNKSIEVTLSGVEFNIV